MPPRIDLSQLPAAAGSYALALRLENATQIAVGRLGPRRFPAGIYLYLGSAGGPGGLRARLGRHLFGAAAHPRWHIDYLRLACDVSGYFYTLQRAELSLPLECAWSQAAAGLPGVWVPISGFGASDCRFRCPAHLVRLPARLLAPSLLVSPLAELLGEVAGGEIVVGGE